MPPAAAAAAPFASVHTARRVACRVSHGCCQVFDDQDGSIQTSRATCSLFSTTRHKTDGTMYHLHRASPSPMCINFARTDVVQALRSLAAPQSIRTRRIRSGGTICIIFPDDRRSVHSFCVCCEGAGCFSSVRSARGASTRSQRPARSQRRPELHSYRAPSSAYILSTCSNCSNFHYFIV